MRDEQLNEVIRRVIGEFEPQEKHEKPPQKSRYMKRVINIIFATAFVLTLVYLYFFWRFQAIPDTLVITTYGFLGVEVVALAKIRWEEVKAHSKEDCDEQN